MTNIISTSLILSCCNLAGLQKAGPQKAGHVLAKIDTLTFRVSNPVRQSGFYRDVLGMREIAAGRLGYSDAEAKLRFVKAQAPYVPANTDLYWKIALSVPQLLLKTTTS